MKEVKLYQCEVCGKNFSTKEEAQRHEQSHENSFTIVGKVYEECAAEDDNYGFPKFIEVAAKPPSLIALYKYCGLTSNKFYGYATKEGK